MWVKDKACRLRVEDTGLKGSEFGVVERERHPRPGVRVCERERHSVWVCVCERECVCRDSCAARAGLHRHLCVFVCVCVCLCMCVCVHVCVCVCACVSWQDLRFSSAGNNPSWLCRTRPKVLEAEG